MRRTLVPLAAALLLAGCGDSATPLSPAAPQFSEHEVEQPSVRFDEAFTNCVWRDDSTSVDCQYRLTNVHHIPEGWRVRITVWQTYEIGFVCTNAKGEFQHDSNGAILFRQETRRESKEVWFRKLTGDISGQAEITASVPKDLCGGRGWFPSVRSIIPHLAALRADAVYKVGKVEQEQEIDRVEFLWESGSDM